MLIWVNHIDRATDRPSMVANSDGQLTAHAVLATYKTRWSTERGNDTFPAEVLLVIFIHLVAIVLCLEDALTAAITKTVLQDVAV